MDYEKFIIDSIQKMAGKRTPYQIFSDWITMTAIAIQNQCTMIQDKVFEDREDLYRTIAKRYDTGEIKNMADMTGALAILLDTKLCDKLGEIYMKTGCGNKYTGQFFTPYHLSYMTAKLIYQEKILELAEDDVIEINEPSAGGGGMIIALAQVMMENEINYQKRLHIVAQDLDWNSVYMTYIQLSLLGMRAVVIQGDSLCEPYRIGYDERRLLRTPTEMGVII